MTSGITGWFRLGCIGLWGLEGVGDNFLLGKNNSLCSDIFFPARKLSPTPSGKPGCMRSGIFEGRYESQGEGGPSKSVRSQGWRSPSVPRTNLKRLLEGPPSSWLGARQKAVKVQ